MQARADFLDMNGNPPCCDEKGVEIPCQKCKVDKLNCERGYNGINYFYNKMENIVVYTEGENEI